MENQVSPGWVFCVRPVPGAFGYFVDRLGNVYSQHKRGGHRPKGQSFSRLAKSLVAKAQGKRDNGYMMASFSLPGKGRFHWMHSLICSAFHGERPEKMEVCHINGVRDDNRSENLRWGTSTENNHDRWDHGTMPHGESHQGSKLTEDQVRQIKYFDKRTHREVAIEYGVSDWTVRNIRSGGVWGHIVEPGMEPVVSPKSLKAKRKT